MGLFTRFSIALSLASHVERVSNEVQELTQIVTQLRMEWTDTLDKLLAREERWRKRYKAEVDRALVPDDSHPQIGSAVADKGQLRSLVAARRRAEGAR